MLQLILSFQKRKKMWQFILFYVVSTLIHIANYLRIRMLHNLHWWKKYCGRIYRPSFRENKPKRLVFQYWKRSFWACFRENWVYKFGHQRPKSTYIPKVPECLSPRPNWDSPIPSPASECALPQEPKEGGGGILAGGWVPIRTTGEIA